MDLITRLKESFKSGRSSARKMAHSEKKGVILLRLIFMESRILRIF